MGKHSETLHSTLRNIKNSDGIKEQMAVEVERADSCREQLLIQNDAQLL